MSLIVPRLLKIPRIHCINLGRPHRQAHPFHLQFSLFTLERDWLRQSLAAIPFDHKNSFPSCSAAACEASEGAQRHLYVLLGFLLEEIGLQKKMAQLLLPRVVSWGSILTCNHFTLGRLKFCLCLIQSHTALEENCLETPGLTKKYF